MCSSFYVLRPSTHKFQIPAWFAHQDSLKDMKKEPIPIVRGHSVDTKQIK